MTTASSSLIELHSIITTWTTQRVNRLDLQRNHAVDTFSPECQRHGVWSSGRFGASWEVRLAADEAD
jgi:hypothetical protein